MEEGSEAWESGNAGGHLTHVAAMHIGLRRTVSQPLEEGRSGAFAR